MREKLWTVLIMRNPYEVVLFNFRYVWDLG